MSFHEAYLLSKSRTHQRVASHFVHRKKLRWGILALTAIIIISDLLLILQPLIVQKSYALGSAESLLPKINQSVVKDISVNEEDKTFTYSPVKNADGSASGINVTAHTSLTDGGISVVDPINNVSFAMKSKDGHYDGRQDGSRIVYPLKNMSGWTVYSIQKTGVKEDILLSKSTSDTAQFSYELTLGESLEARLEKDGSLGVYGNTLLSGDISAASEADAQLLLDARKNAQKNTLLFTIPAPVVVEPGNITSQQAKASFSLEGSTLTINVTGLKNATYPLSIDPSIYVVSARQFMAGNNETNINFNVDEQLIEKSPTTGARFDTWEATTPLPVLTTASGVTVAGGYIYSVGGKSYSEQVFNTQGASTYVVPDGITSLTVRTWGGGGGGAGGGSSGVGGSGGGGGSVYATIPVTPGETLNLYVGGGGAGGNYNSGGNDAGGGGGGGGYTSIYRGSTPLVIAAGGGGGGGGQATRAGGAGGAGGGTSGANGGQGYAANNGAGGTGGTLWAIGAGGTGGNNSGSNGASLLGGAGADGRSAQGADGSGAAGGAMGGGNGGLPNVSTTRAGGGGGGGGYNGGGGGGSTTNSTSASGGGGGGGASYTDSTLTGITNAAGSGTTPGNDTYLSRNGAGGGGSGGAGLANGSSGNNGLIVITFGTGTTVTKSVSWAEFNTNTGTVDSANPGSGACSGWCTSSAYDLPSARSNFSLVTYNGYLYAIGGLDENGNRQSTVYVSKLGANGEPQLWHPTDTNKSNWVYWYQDTGLSSVRSHFSALTYNNRLYILGGIGAGNNIVNSVEYADILPTGQLGSWTTGTQLTTNRYSMSAHTYNNRLYILGGSEWWIGGPPITTVQYAQINSDGSIGSWVSTTPLQTGRASSGGNFSASWGGYLYVSGGCGTLDYNGYCTSVLNTTQLASINADGSLDVWNTVGSADDQRVGGTLVTWRGYLYAVGGCLSQDTSTGACGAATLDSIRYGKINPDGDASTVAQSSASGAGLCTGSTPSQCNLPGTTYIGNMLTGSIIHNGILYIAGGCTNNTCSTTSNDVIYTSINTDGSTGVPSCPGGTIQGGTWCFLSNVLPTATAASSAVVFNNRLYLVGGLTGTANSNTILRTDIATDGSLGAWTSQTMTGVGATNVSYQYAYARANPSAAATNPGNLYIFGGCSTSSAAGCTAYAQAVYKCNIQTAGAIASCSTSGQLQIGIIPGDTATGLGIMSGTVYANYIYLIGGVSPNIVDMDTVRYAKFDNNNNVVTAGPTSAWVESSNKMHVGRRRAAAFGYNGYIYVTGGYEDGGAGVIADIEFIKMNVSDGSLGSASEGFTVSSVQINQRWGLTVAVSNSYAYVIGGCTTGASPSGCTARTDVIQTFQIYNNNSGAPANYTTSANTYGSVSNRIGASATILNGRLYVAGGCTGATDCAAVTNDVSYATLDTYGNIGSWSSTGLLPAGRAWGQLETAGGSLYYIGGQSATATDRRAEVYYTTPTGTGSITSWATASNGLPGGRTNFGGTVWNNRLYVVGGQGTNTGCTSNICNTVYVSPQLNNGGNITSAWSTTSASFTVAREGGMAVAYANNLYLIGGSSGGTYFSDVQYSKIDSSTGSAGAWSYTESLPNPLAQGEGFAANGYIYVLGGRSAATSCQPATYVAPISANTSISSGNSPTGVGTWYQSNKRYTGNRYGAAVAYNDGKAYIMGGGCGATLTYANPVTQQSTLLSQPQIARYSILIDTDTDVFPTSWLLNGVDNSTGANWQLKYRSMTNTTTSCISPAMTTWGQETNFGNVTLGLPGVYIPKNSAGVNTNCARFYFFNVAVDSSQAYGYPDDVTRGPTITDLTLQFTADPSKRLMHGRTFTGGLQQPVDTPYYSN